MGKKAAFLAGTVTAAAAATAIIANQQRKKKAEGIEIEGLDVDQKLKDLRNKAEELQAMALNATQESRDDLKITITNVKGEAINKTEQFKRNAERSKSKLYSELLKAQMNFEVKKEEIEKDFQEKKFESEKEKAYDKAVKRAEDAQALMDYALEMVENATVASLEATELAKEYEEKYGEAIDVADEDDFEEDGIFYDDDLGDVAATDDEADESEDIDGAEETAEEDKAEESDDDDDDDDDED